MELTTVSSVVAVVVAVVLLTRLVIVGRLIHELVAEDRQSYDGRLMYRTGQLIAQAIALLGGGLTITATLAWALWSWSSSPTPLTSGVTFALTLATVAMLSIARPSIEHLPSMIERRAGHAI